MKINNICFYYRYNPDFEIKRSDEQNHYRLLFFRKRASFLHGEKEMPDIPSTVILLDKNEAQIFDADELFQVAEWIDFELEEEERERLRRSEFPVNKKILIRNSQTLLDVLQMMHWDFYANQPQQEKMLAVYFELFFTKLYDIVMDNRAKKKLSQYENLLSIRAEIYAEPTKRMSVKELAAKAYLSTSYFQHLYKECFHTSVVSDMIFSRIERGKHLLISTNYNIKEIAKELNYSSDVSFARQFRKVTGVSPGKYKEQFGKR